MAAIITAGATIIAAFIQGGVPASLFSSADEPKKAAATAQVEPAPVSPTLSEPQDGAAPVTQSGPLASPPKDEAATDAALSTRPSPAKAGEGKGQETSPAMATSQVSPEPAPENWGPATANSTIETYSGKSFGAKTNRKLTPGQTFEIDGTDTGAVWIKARKDGAVFYILKSADYQQSD